MRRGGSGSCSLFALCLRCGDGRGLRLGLQRCDGENPEKVFVETKDALHFLGRLRFVRVVDDKIVSFAILADGVGEGSQPPGFGSVDGRTGFFELLLRFQGDVFGLAAREVLSQDKDGFVVRHRLCCFLLFSPVGGDGSRRL